MNKTVRLTELEDNSKSWSAAHVVMIFVTAAGCVFIFFALGAICYRKQSFFPNKDNNDQIKKPLNFLTPEQTKYLQSLPNAVYHPGAAGGFDNGNEQNRIITFGSMPSYKEDKIRQKIQALQIAQKQQFIPPQNLSPFQQIQQQLAAQKQAEHQKLAQQLGSTLQTHAGQPTGLEHHQLPGQLPSQPAQMMAKQTTPKQAEIEALNAQAIKDELNLDLQLTTTQLIDLGDSTAKVTASLSNALQNNLVGKISAPEKGILKRNTTAKSLIAQAAAQAAAQAVGQQPQPLQINTGQNQLIIAPAVNQQQAAGVAYGLGQLGSLSQLPTTTSGQIGAANQATAVATTASSSIRIPPPPPPPTRPALNLGLNPLNQFNAQQFSAQINTGNLLAHNQLLKAASNNLLQIAQPQIIDDASSNTGDEECNLDAENQLNDNLLADSMDEQDDGDDLLEEIYSKGLDKDDDLELLQAGKGKPSRLKKLKKRAVSKLNKVNLGSHHLSLAQLHNAGLPHLNSLQLSNLNQLANFNTINLNNLNSLNSLNLTTTMTEDSTCNESETSDNVHMMFNNQNQLYFDETRADSRNRLLDSQLYLTNGDESNSLSEVERKLKHLNGGYHEEILEALNSARQISLRGNSSMSKMASDLNETITSSENSCSNFEQLLAQLKQQSPIQSSSGGNLCAVTGNAVPPPPPNVQSSKSSSVNAFHQLKQSQRSPTHSDDLRYSETDSDRNLILNTIYGQPVSNIANSAKRLSTLKRQHSTSATPQLIHKPLNMLQKSNSELSLEKDLQYLLGNKLQQPTTLSAQRYDAIDAISKKKLFLIFFDLLQSFLQDLPATGEQSGASRPDARESNLLGELPTKSTAKTGTTAAAK